MGDKLFDFWKRGYVKSFGNYPAEYNRAVHGPYYPFVNYGPRDTPIQDVKLGEMKKWLARRNYAPYAIVGAITRTYYKWHFNWFETRLGSPSKFVFQFMIGLSVGSMLLSYSVYRNHRMHKYHW